ncbi:MAG: hypothetical protein WC359_13845 [Dehalococcoidia bacterium]|jgi:hypothetical protein
MSDLETGMMLAATIAAIFIVMWTWKSVKTQQFNMEAARSRRMSQVRAARGNAPAPTPSPSQQEATPEWVYSLLGRLGIEEIPDEEPPGLASALNKYEPLIRPFIKGFMDGQQQPAGDVPDPVTMPEEYKHLQQPEQFL